MPDSAPQPAVRRARVAIAMGNSPRRFLPACLCLFLGLHTVATAIAADPRDRDRQAAGLDQELIGRTLTQAAELPRIHSLVVARDGAIVLDHVFTGPASDQPANIKSLSKTVMAALVGAAIQHGLVAGVDQPVVDLLGDLLPANADPRVGDITVGNLLSMQAGLERTSGEHYAAWVASDNWVSYALTRPFVDAPGGTMQYSTGSSHILSAALTRASGRSTLALSRDWLGDGLDIHIPAWLQDPQGIYFGGNDMQLSPLALLRLGELYRLDGLYNGQRLLPEGWVASSWTTRGHSRYTGHDYGYGWYTTALAGQRVHYGRGFGGQMLYVIPALAMTVVITSDPTPPSPGGSYFRQLSDLLEHGVIPAAMGADAHNDGNPALSQSH